jgi:beta-xylosidase
MLNDGAASVIMVSAQTARPVVEESVPLKQKRVFLKAECDFRNMADRGYFFYSLDGKTWTSIGIPLEMEYSMPHFMGYRFGLFNYATSDPGGYVDFDWFRIDQEISNTR